MIVYDIETLPNLFSLTAMDATTGEVWVFEMSERQNDILLLVAWLRYLQENKIDMVGYNNIGFDYPIIHFILLANGLVTVEQIYEKAMSIINSYDKFAHTIWPNDWFIPQIDLFKIYHFDNQAKSTSLKALQFNMRSDSVEDMPIAHGTMIQADQIPALLSYNLHDVTETAKFLGKSMEQVEFRRYLSDLYNRDFMNHNDTKIGKDYFIMRLEEQNPEACYMRGDGGREPRQTPRASIPLVDVIFPYVAFNHPEFQRALDWLKGHTVVETKGKLGLSATIDGFTFDFGTGGIHGSVESQVVREDEHYALIDIDVASYYPNIAIANRVFPEHLGELFCDIYKDVYEQRKQHKKGTPENAMLKLALNGVYGDSNNVYSPFYDPQYTMSITINGQLLLCMLAEQLMTIPGLTMIQINTDGLTIRVPRVVEQFVVIICKWWEAFTCLTLEDVRYSMMAVRDVNNYLAVTTEGKVKRKGAYDSRLPGERFDVPALGWHQNTSSLVVAKAAEAAIVKGLDVTAFIHNHTEPFDFMVRAKATGASHLVLVMDDGAETPLQKTTRMYVARQGGSVFKNSPPPPNEVEGWYKRSPKVSKTDYAAWHAAWGNVHNPEIHTKNKSIYENRRTGILVGWKCAECNRAEDFDWANLNYDYYIQEAMKLVQAVNLYQSAPPSDKRNTSE